MLGMRSLRTLPKGAMLAVLALVLMGLLLALGTRPAQAADLTVNSTADPGDGTCDAAECTLREAIGQANLNGQPDTITFDLTPT